LSIHEALKTGRYKGEWFIPTPDLLLGVSTLGTRIQDDNLYCSRDIGAFRNTFETGGSRGGENCYWSSTRYPVRDSSFYIVRFQAGLLDWAPVGAMEMSCRPVRVEPRP
jgi:hypothetical protein